ncbi:hypothetical protein JCM8547_001023 [Rhodosporidiobolus lusitaniae]
MQDPRKLRKAAFERERLKSESQASVRNSVGGERGAEPVRTGRGGSVGGSRMAGSLRRVTSSFAINAAQECTVPRVHAQPQDTKRCSSCRKRLPIQHYSNYERKKSDGVCNLCRKRERDPDQDVKNIEYVISPLADAPFALFPRAISDFSSPPLLFSCDHSIQADPLAGFSSDSEHSLSDAEDPAPSKTGNTRPPFLPPRPSALARPPPPRPGPPRRRDNLPPPPLSSSSTAAAAGQLPHGLSYGLDGPEPQRPGLTMSGAGGQQKQEQRVEYDDGLTSEEED